MTNRDRQPAAARTRGRPPLPDEDRRTEVVKFRLSPRDLAKLERAADAEEITVCAWVRNLALEAAGGAA